MPSFLRTTQCVLLRLSGTCWAQQSLSQQWQGLLHRNQTEETRRLCTSWISSNEIVQRVEGYKCLANVAISGKQVLMLEGNEQGGGSLRDAYTPEATDEALGYLQKALELTPQDLSIHRGRLYVLENASRFEDMAKALDDSCRTYKGREGADAWIAYTSELFQDGQYTADLALLRVLEKYFPNSHDVIGNTGAVYMSLKKDDAALPYLQKAVEIAPNDPIDTWNLGRLYDFMGQTKDADIWYQKALKLKWDDADNLRSSGCLYATFIEEKLKDFERACRAERAYCDTAKQTACSKRK